MAYVQFAAVSQLICVLLFPLALTKTALSQQTISGQDTTNLHHQSSVTSSDKRAKHYLGAQIGSPIMIACQYDFMLAKRTDSLPRNYLSAKLGFSFGLNLGHGASLTYSHRMGNSSFFPTIGIHYLRQGYRLADFKLVYVERMTSVLVSINRCSLGEKTFRQISVGILIGLSEDEYTPRIYPTISLSWTNPL